MKDNSYNGCIMTLNNKGMTLRFCERITYSADWSESGEEWEKHECFPNVPDLGEYLKIMDWRIVSHGRLPSN